MRYRYVKFGVNSPYMEAPPDVVNAINNPCAYRAPPPDSNCPPNAFNDAPIKIEDNSSMGGDWIAHINNKGKIQMFLSTENNADVLQYNEDLKTKSLAKRIASELGTGGAKNKKRRTKRHHKASRRKASRRSTGKK